MFYCLSVAATAGALVPPADVALAWPEGEAAMEDFERRLRHLRRYGWMLDATYCLGQRPVSSLSGRYVAEEMEVASRGARQRWGG